MTLSGAAARELSPLDPLVRRVEAADVLDPPAQKLAQAVRGGLSGSLKDALSGTWLGHALHPVLTDVVIGSFLSANLLDLLGGRESRTASRRLIAIGIAAYGPTALTGVSDWADAEPLGGPIRRTGLAHAAGNLLALSLYGASLASRRRGAHGRGVMLGGLGAAVLTVGGHLGGHLSLRQGVGPDQTVYDPGPEEWTAATEAGQLADGQPQRVVVEDTPVLLLRHGEQVHAIHDRCSHRGCSLSEGEIDGHEVTCGCHGSRFDLRDGSLLHGPATAGQPAYETREREGQVEIRLAPRA